MSWEMEAWENWNAESERIERLRVRWLKTWEMDELRDRWVRTGWVRQLTGWEMESQELLILKSYALSGGRGPKNWVRLGRRYGDVRWVRTVGTYPGTGMVRGYGTGVRYGGYTVPIRRTPVPYPPSVAVPEARTYIPYPYPKARTCVPYRTQTPLGMYTVPPVMLR